MIRTPMDSPALRSQSEHYPERFGARVPLRVRLLDTVRSEPLLSFGRPGGALVAYSGQEYEVWVNSHGAVALVLSDREDLLGVTPDEFEVISWHEQGGAA